MKEDQDIPEAREAVENLQGRLDFEEDDVIEALSEACRKYAKRRNKELRQQWSEVGPLIAERDSWKSRAEKAEKAQQEAQSEMLGAMSELTTLRNDVKPLLKLENQNSGFIAETIHGFLSKHPEFSKDEQP